jgi:transposase-like protein
MRQSVWPFNEHMFGGPMGSYKPEKRDEARRLRREEGIAIKKIARRIGVSPSSVLVWTRDIELTPEQLDALQVRERSNRESFRSRAKTWRHVARLRRLDWQEQGRRRARLGDPLHEAGCMLYWAEGGKSRNLLSLVNSDANMLRFFARFLRECLEVESERFRVRLNVYLGNGLSMVEIEDFWLDALEAPRSCLRKHTLNSYPTSSSGQKRSLRYGVCTLRVAQGTPLVQHIYGAIQEYAGFEEPHRLDGPPRKQRKKKQAPTDTDRLDNAA